MKQLLLFLFLFPVILFSQSSDLVTVTIRGNEKVLSLNQTKVIFPNPDGSSKVLYGNNFTQFDVAEAIDFFRDSTCNLFLYGHFNRGSEILINKRHIDRVEPAPDGKAQVMMSGGKRYTLLELYIVSYPQLLEGSGDCIAQHNLSISSTDSILLDMNNSVITIGTPNGDTSHISDYENQTDGWIGFLRVVNDAVVIPPNGQMFCNDTTGTIIELDTIDGTYLSPAYVSGDSMILSQCPIDYTESIEIPLELSVFAWYDATKYIDSLSNGVDIDTLYDWSGNDHGFSSSGTGGGPDILLNTINGLPVFDFDRDSSEFFTHADTTFSFLHYDSSTIVSIVKVGNDSVTSPDTLYTIMGSQDSLINQGYSLYYDDRTGVFDEVYFQVASDTAVVTNGAFASSATPNQFHYLFCESDPTNATENLRSRTKINAGTYTRGNTFDNPAEVATNAAFNIGRNTHSTIPDFFTGQIAEILIFDRILTATEITILNDYLVRKYGISL